MPGRSFNGGNYRYGFDGQENDNDIAGINGANTTAENWEYDSRLGRRWEIDPVSKAWESPYATFANDPIYFIDPNGDDADDNKGGNTAGAPEKAKDELDKESGVGGHVSPTTESEVLKHKDTNFQSTSKDGSTTTNYYYEKGPDGKGGYVRDDHWKARDNVTPATPSGEPSREAAPDPKPAAKPDPKPEPKQDPKPSTQPKPSTGKGPSKDMKVVLDHRPTSSRPPTPHRPDVLTTTPPVHSVPHPPPPPPAPLASQMCWTCFMGESDLHWQNGLNSLTDWLSKNPDYDIGISADGGGSSLWPGGNTWNSSVAINGKGETYQQRLDRRISVLQNAIKAKGIDPSRIHKAPSNVNGGKLEYKVTKK